MVSRNIAIDQPDRPASRNATAVAPAVPIIPVTPSRTATPTHKKAKKDGGATESEAVKFPVEEARVPTTTPTTPAKANKKSSPTKAHAAVTPKKAVNEPSSAMLKESKAASASPTKVTPKNKATNKKTPAVAEMTPQKDTKSSAPGTVPSSSKRQPLGKLDISAATNEDENQTPSMTASTKLDAMTKPARITPTAAPASVPPSPAATSSGSPIKKPIGAKTLRVVATPKTESPPQFPPIPSTGLPQVPTVEKLRSRQASIASINLPGTPASELISDTASFTSTSISRANSPPLVGGKIGTAPVRKKTKSQAKKERQERARQAEEERALEEHTPEPEVVQAPIVGRKKKAKKPANNSKLPVAPPKTPTEPVKPVQPIPKDEEELEELYQADIAAKKATATKPSVPSPPAESVAEQGVGKEKREPTAQSILADLQKTGELVASALEFFKPLSSSLAHAPRGALNNGGPVGPPDLKIRFTEADLEAHAKKLPARPTCHDGTSDIRSLITPQGKFFWGLSEELEEKALDLEKRIEDVKGAARFHAKKHTTQNAGSHGQPHLPALATALKEASAKLSKRTSQDIPRLDPAYQENNSQRLALPPVQTNDDLAPNQAQPPTPADAGVYLNQFVLPNTDNPPPNAPRPEMAAVGGLPGAGTANTSAHANKLAKAAKAVAEGGAVGPELEGIGAMAADLLGDVFVQNLEALVGADLGFGLADFGLDNHGGPDAQGFTNPFEAGAASGFGLDGRKGRRSVLSVEEAEQAMLAARKDHEALEKKLNTLIKKNRKILNAGKA